MSNGISPRGWRMNSTRSRRLSLDQWRSSTTSTSGRRRAASSIVDRQAAKTAARSASSTSPAPIVAASRSAVRSAASSPESDSHRRIPLRSASGGRSPGSSSRSRSNVRIGQNVRRWPYGRHWAIATCTPGRFRWRRSVNSSSRRDLPTPGGAITLTRNGRRSSNARLATRSSWARSAPRPMSGVRRAGRRVERPRSSLAATGWALPLAATSVGGRNAKASRAALAVRSATTIAHGSAACWSRAATFTASPVTRKSPAPASRLATTSPLFTPSRIGRRSPSAGSARTRSRSSRAAASARSASSPCAVGRPKTAIKASPMNFSIVPPWLSTTSRPIAK